MKHYLITEWNVDMIDLEWLTERQVLFEKFTYPSVMSQINKDFTWVLVSDARTPDSFKKVLESYDAEVLYFNFDNYNWQAPKYPDHGKAYMPSYQIMQRSIDLEYISRPIIDYIGDQDTDFIITSRLDNDDAISVDHIDRINTAAKLLWSEGCIDQHYNAGDRFWLNFTRGYKWCSENVYPVNSLHSPFISFVESPVDMKTTYQACHTTANDTKYPLVNIKQGQPTWMQVIHGKNLVNKLMRYAGEKPFEEVTDRFKING